ncbi:MAG: PAS domain S-box protein [Methanolinea sp.]|nr:PAS domain S-box protein [Methanolinea sp.]
MNHSQSENLARIKQLLSHYPEGLCINEIARALARHRNSVSRDLHALLVSGQVQDHAFGTTRVFTLVRRDETFSVLDSICDMVLILDLKGTILTANAPLLGFLGEGRENIFGHNVCEFPLLSKLISWKSSEEIPGEWLRGTTTRFHSQDDQSHYDVTSRPVLCEDGNEGRMIVVHDRSEIENLRRLNHGERWVLDAITGDLSLLVIQLSPEGRLISGNAPFLSRFCPSLQGTDDTEFSLFLAPADASFVKSCIEGLSCKEPVTTHIFSMVDSSGRKSLIEWKFHGFFDDGLHLRYSVGIGSDVTDAVVSRNRTREMENNIKLLSNAIADFQRVNASEDIFSCIPLHIGTLVPGSRIAVFEVHQDTGTCCFKGMDRESQALLHPFSRDYALETPSLSFVIQDVPSVPQKMPEPGSYIWTGARFSRSFLAHLKPGEDIPAWVADANDVCCAGIGESGRLCGVVEIFADRNAILAHEEFLLHYLKLVALVFRQAALLQSEMVSGEQFRTIALNSPHPISIIDRNGRYIYLNPCFSDLFGYTIDDIPDGKTWFIKAFPDLSEQRRARGLWREDLASSPPGKVRPRQFKVRCKNGQFLEILFLPVMLSNGDHIVIYQDMTPILEGALRQNLLDDLFKSSQDGIFSVTPDGRILSWNPAAERIYGYPAGEIIGKDIAILEPASLKGEVHRILRQVMTGEPLVAHETRRVRRDGKVIDVSLTVSPICNDKQKVVGSSTIVRDISQKKAEERLKSAEGQYRESVGDINVGVYRSTGDPEGKFVWGNTSLVGILGFESMDLLKDISVSSLFSEAGGRTELLAALKRDGFVKNRKIQLRRPDGRVIHVLVTAIATFNPDQTIAHINGIVEDVTYTKFLEEQITKLGDRQVSRP